MSSEGGNTTVTAARAPAAGAAVSRTTSVLAWLFPRSGTDPIDLVNTADDLTIGRDEGCAVQLIGNDVSRRHAVLRGSLGGSGARIADLGSRNGVRVNGRLVSEAEIHPGAVVRLGGWIGVVTSNPGPLRHIAPGLWGGARLDAALEPLRRAAPSDLPIVLQGETGTGKEVVTRTLHAWSGRTGPLVAVNCAALPANLAEGELFGYRRGAFTGADRASPGFFRSAEGGTLLLDEISDLPLALQAKLLRVLEERAVQPLGEARPVPVDVRIVVAGQQPLIDVVRAKAFRADLLARLDGLTVELPPLRDRREDVLPLFTRLLEEAGEGRAPAIDSDLAERLCIHDWPFNVRELVLLVRRLVALHGTETTLQANHLPSRIGEGASAGPADQPSPPTAGPAPVIAGPALREPVQLPALIAALRASRGVVARAAALLGISRQRAYRLMEAQGVDLDGLRGEPGNP
jgi:transcriptional regulator of acetoin/glycerol metabolism